MIKPISGYQQQTRVDEYLEHKVRISASTIFTVISDKQEYWSRKLDTVLYRISS